MSISEAFETLKLTPTHEERAIRDAYHALLKGVNPEDDPEGFKRLREAYEQAIVYARTPKEEEEGPANVQWLQNQAVGGFLQQLADIYTLLPRRIDLAEWDGLLSDPVLQSLEDGESAKWGLFSYLAEHFRLPDRIWRRLDKEFFIQENQKEFREHLPNGFVDYILDKLKEEHVYQEFPYEFFQGAPDADYDLFIREYMDYINQHFDHTEEGLEERGRLLARVTSHGITHPWCEMQIAIYLLDRGEYEQFETRIQKLLAEYPKDEQIVIVTAEIFEEKQRDKEAKKLFADYLEQEQQSKFGIFRSCFGLARIAAREGMWKEALTFANSADEVGNNDALKELYKEIYQHLIADLLTREDTLEEDDVSLLGTCFIQGGQWEEGLAFFDRHPEYRVDTCEYYENVAVLNMYAGRCEQTLEEAKHWRECLDKQTAASQEDADFITHKLGQSFYVEGCVLGQAYRKELEAEAPVEERLEELSKTAQKAFEKALSFQPENKNILIGKVLLLRDLKDDKGVIDVCEQALYYDPNHFQACYFLQEAYENLGMAQQVVDTFYRAKAIYDGNAMIYLRAVKVFMAYRQFDDALGIIHQAEEAHVSDPALLAKKACAICRRVKEKDKKGFQEAKKYASEITKQLEKENADPRFLAELYLERAYLYETANQLKAKGKAKIQRFIRKSVELHDTIEARYFLGRTLLRYEKKPEEAYEQFKICEERKMDFKWLYFYIAQCHEDLKQEDDAIEYYEKLWEKDPEFNDCCWRIGWIYRKKLRKTMVKEYGEKALYYFNLQEEKFGAGYSLLRWRSYVYLCLNEPQKALQDAENGLEKKKDSGLWLLRGRALKTLGRYEEAIENFKNSIRCEERYGEDDSYCYGRIFDCYKFLNKLKQAADFFEAELEVVVTEELKEECLEQLVRCAAIQGAYAVAFQWLEKQYGTTSLSEKGEDIWSKVAERIEDVLDIWLIYKGTIDKEYLTLYEDAKKLAAQAWKDESADPKDRALVLHNLGECCFYQGNRWEEAYTYFKKAYQLVQKDKEYKYYRNLVNSLMTVCYWMGDLEQAKTYAEEYKERLENSYKGCEKLHKSIEELMTIPAPDSRQNLYNLFCYAYYTGQYERARGYLELMCGRNMCFWCDEKDCTELWEAKGLMALYDNKEAEAIEAFHTSNRCCWLYGTRTAHMMLRILENRKKE